MASQQINTYVEGNVLNFEVQFTNELTGAAINPTNVAFGYRVNGGNVTSFTYGVGSQITNPSTGTFAIQIATVSLPGTWVWEWQSTGNGAAVVSGAITVTPKPMTLL